MSKLLLFAIIGFFAQLIDGSLGMGFGATSSSLLLLFAVAPAVVSASIHIAEIATTAASGASHLKFGNVDKPLLYRMIIPGSISAFIGAAFLSGLPGDVIKPYISIFLLVLGGYIMYRFLIAVPSTNQSIAKPLKRIVLIPMSALAGFFDAVGGGGWGPVNTPFLLSRKGAIPRKVIGTVDTSEFAVTLSASLGFIIFLGWEQISWFWVAAFAIGGVCAAPIAAWLVKIMPTHLLGVLVGGLIIFTNVNILLIHFLNGFNNGFYVIYIVLLALWAYAVFFAHSRNKKIQLEDNENHAKQIQSSSH
ncbi:sulfite exporter TauE/SafE family protein [Aureibacillus halotolerans]|uniref:Probable membrane transporter protein n=1 Tax=Aureibacillus halotolerans TaxID=1508390 RepID=A0A4V6PWI6_9BACI|nr:sulfite exporter TauE/SafE family protein [Aureibacillus halotolerans]TDQ40827.1 hypothetical protein EV213_105173 [Aureibacillus halotolerans]